MRGLRFKTHKRFGLLHSSSPYYGSPTPLGVLGGLVVKIQDWQPRILKPFQTLLRLPKPAQGTPAGRGVAGFVSRFLPQIVPDSAIISSPASFIPTLKNSW